MATQSAMKIKKMLKETETELNEKQPKKILATLSGNPLEFEYTAMQNRVFWGCRSKYVVLSAGRRSGKTYGASQFCIERLLDTSTSIQILWVDLVYSQIQNYYERYFLPILNKLSPNLWSWNQQRKELTILNNKLLFRSADRPDLLVGLSYNLIIINEAGIALYEDPSLYTTILLPMLLDYPGSRLFALGTPRGILGKDGQESIFYKLFKRGQEGDPQVSSYKYTSYDNPTLTKKDIQELEEEVSPRERLQEIYAEFVSLSDVPVFMDEWWKYAETLPKTAEIRDAFISIDTAFGVKTVNDESAATVWLKLYNGNYYCIDCWHDRLEYPSLVRKIKELADKYSPDYLLIENKASGQSLVQTLKEDMKLPIRTFEPNRDRISDNYDRDKVSRASSITNIIEAGKVYLLRARWNKDLTNQCAVFPLGSHDDIVDTISMALIHSRNREFNINQISSRRVSTTPLLGYGDHALTIKNYYK